MSRTEKKIVAAFFIAFFIFALLFVPSGDDWERIAFADRTLSGYGRLIVDQYLHLNGRILGNLFSFLLMVPVWLRALLKAVCVTVIGYALYALSGLKRPAGLFLSLFLVTAVPLGMHVQVYAWSAGFFNYTIPMAIILAFVCYKERGKRPLRPWVAWLAGFTSCLFVEHVTMLLLLIGATALVYGLWKKKKDLVWTAFFLGVVAGVAIMFASPAYRTVAEGTDWYRSVPDSKQAVWNLIAKNYDRMGPYIFGWEAWAAALTWIGASVLLWKAEKKRWIVVWTALCLSMLVFHFPWEPRPMFQVGLRWKLYETIFFHFALTLGLWLVLYFQTAPLVQNPVRFRMGLWFWMLGFGPLLFVHPIGPRNYYLGAMALTFITLHIAYSLGWERWTAVRRGVLAALCGMFLWRGFFHTQNILVFAEREKRIENAMKRGDSEVLLPAFPHIRYIHGDQTESLVYGHFYVFPGDLKFHVEGEERTH